MDKFQSESFYYSARKGLHAHTIPRTMKLKILPITSPPTTQKLPIGAAMSTSSLRPLSRGLCSSDGAPIKHMLDTYPLVTPNPRSNIMYAMSELIIGGADGDEASRWMLHARKSGIKSVRASERPRRCLADQITSRGIPQRYRPNQSPTLKTRKWSKLKMSGCIAVFGTINIVMAGKTDCIEYHITSGILVSELDDLRG
jgi:hypothetical protein